MDEVAASNEGREHRSASIGADRRVVLTLLPFQGLLWACGFTCMFLFILLPNEPTPEYSAAFVAFAFAAAFLVRFGAHILAVTKTRYCFDSAGFTIAGPFKVKQIPWNNVRHISARRWRNGGIRKIAIHASRDLFAPRELTEYWDLKRIEAAIRASKPMELFLDERRSLTDQLPNIKVQALIAGIVTAAFGYIVYTIL